MARVVALTAFVWSAFATKQKCCWSKWGATCGGYPSEAHGAKCATDWTKTCSSDGECPQPSTPIPVPPALAPVLPPAPSPPSALVVGYWSTTWAHVTAPSNANLGIAFSGWVDPAKAKSASAPAYASLVGDKWIDAGGGNANGRWSAAWLTKWEATIKRGDLKQWKGIVFDIEECSSAGLAPKFASTFRAAKAAGLQVLVTVSHSGPYGCSDADVLMKSFFPNNDVDYFSPQLYTSGSEAEPNFDAGKVTWGNWTGFKGRLVPSLGCPALKHGGLQKTKDFFSKYKLDVAGYIMWPSSGCSLSAENVVMV